jgi:hypothetical protein
MVNHTLDPSDWLLQRIGWQTQASSHRLTPVPAICTWMDISGFRAKLESANWDLEVAQSKGLIEILNHAYEIAAKPILLGIPPTPLERLLVLNDGIARTIDLPAGFGNDPFLAALYMRDVLTKHFLLLPYLVSKGLGLRTVLAGGQRIQYAPEQISGKQLLQASNPVSEQGKRFASELFLYHPAPFQMNTAFSKAYLIEQDHLERNSVYFDKTFFDVLNEAIPGSLQMGRDNPERQTTYLRRNGKNLIQFIHKPPRRSLRLKSQLYHVTKFIVGKAFDGDEVEFPLTLTEINRVRHL